VFWDTGSYLFDARWIGRHHGPRYGSFRTPGYPIFILFAGGRDLNLGRIVVVQEFLGVACNVLVASALWCLTRRRWVAVAGGLASVMAVSVTFLEVTIYSETLARFLMTAAVAAFAASAVPSRAAVAALLAGAAAVGLAPLARPTLIVVVPLTLVLFGFLWRRGSISVRTLVAALIFATLPLGLLLARNLVRERFFGLSHAVGQSVLDVAGDPLVYRSLPPRLSGIRAVYEQAVRDLGRERIFAWEAAPRLAVFERGEGKIYPNTDELERAVAWRCIRAVPLAYARCWADAFRRFLCDEDLLFGYYESPGRTSVGPQVGGLQDKFVLCLDRFWRAGVPAVSVLALVVLPIGIVLDRGRRRRVMLIALWAWGACLAVALMSTALETSPGQARYRAPLSDVLIVLALAGVAALVRAVRNKPVGTP
jgi:hypothetical protein